MANKARDFLARFLTDTSSFETAPAQRELEDLADESERTARRIDDSFDRVKRSADSSLDDLGSSTKGKAREAGAEVGAEFTENMGEAFRSGDIGGLVTESLTSLAPALGAAGIGIGIGAALISNMVAGIKEQKQKLTEATQRVVDNIDIDLTTFAAKFDIAKFYNDSLDALTEGGLAEDIAKFQKLAKQTVGEDSLTKIIAGQADGTIRAQLEALAAQAETSLEQNRGRTRQAAIENKSALNEVLDLLDRQEAAYKAGNDAVRTQIDSQKVLAGYIRTANGLLSQQSQDALAARGLAGRKLWTDDR